MNMGNYTRALASAAVLGVAVVGPLAAPAQAAPGGNSGHAKAGQAKAGHATSSDHATSGNAPKGGQAKAHSPGSRPSGNAGGGNGAAHANNQSGQANGHSNAGGAPAPAASPPSSPPPDQGPKADKGPRADKGGDPAGNNGTVKIETSPAGKDAPNNVPHVGCTFQLEWYGFDEGDDIISTVDFQMHSPTSDVALGGYQPTEVFVGGDPAGGAGTGSGFDGRQTYTLSFDGEPHAQQGYHVKLTIHTPGSQGADTKHKVFWVEPCEEETPPGGEEETPPGGEDETPPGGEEETPPGGQEETPPTVEGKQKTDVDRDHEVEVAGKQQAARVSPAPAEVPTAVEAGVAGDPTGTSPLAHLIVTLGGLLAALGFLLRRRNA